MLAYVPGLTSLAISAFYGTGCSPDVSLDDIKQKEVGTFVAPVSKHIWELDDSDVLVEVNGNALTRGRLSEIARFQASMLARKLNAPMSDKRVLEFQEECERGGIAQYVIQQVLAEEGERRGLKVTPEMEKEQVRTFAELLDITLDDASYKYLARVAQVSEAAVRSFMEGNQLAQLVQNSVAVAPESIPYEDVSNLVAHVTRANIDCAASNKMQTAILMEALSCVRAGMTFAEAAKRFSEIQPDDGESWGPFTKAELRLYEHSGRDFSEWAFSAEIGSITSEPVQFDDGVGIAQILERTEGVDEVSAVSIVDVKTVRLARITRKAFDPPPMLNEDQARAKIAAERTKDAQIEFNKSLFLNSRIYYTNGTNLWDSTETNL